MNLIVNSFVSYLFSYNGTLSIEEITSLLVDIWSASDTHILNGANCVR